MSLKKRLHGSDLLKVLDTSRNPLELGKARNDAIHYIERVANTLPENESKEFTDYVYNFNSYRHMSEQLRELASWVEKANEMQ